MKKLMIVLALTATFAVKVGQKLEFEFEPRDMDGTITKVKALP
jgi:hypothetical protein